MSHLQAVENLNEVMGMNVKRILWQSDREQRPTVVEALMHQGQVHDVFRSSEVAVALLYLDRAAVRLQLPKLLDDLLDRNHNAEHNGVRKPSDTREKLKQRDVDGLFIAALHLACKYLQDDPFTTKSIAQICRIPPRVIVKYELVLLSQIGCNLSIDRESWEAIHHIVTLPIITHPLQNDFLKGGIDVAESIADKCNHTIEQRIQELHPRQNNQLASEVRSTQAQNIQSPL
eukprot:TRINITY_DN2676_c0_g1_i1.p1 TRINITY_DN2676_c0_g1~~TRINITY_DN2676_c0_g1_i1.p1  ORF type:complete len:231 (-),score=35.26 TRINITY_DN2676_c0_g1_i1:713-1405(-)